jgi:hypothetical protein
MQATTGKSLLLLLSPFALLGSTQAAKDGAYYRPGSGNPNIYEKMYWKDADNVLQDLDQFSSLYVEFHHCAWTWTRSDEDADNDVDENDYWYMGSVPPFGANVAFSLYGALKGESFAGCSSNTFINSFYTSSGFTDFVYAMQYAGVSQFSATDFSAYSSECGGGYGVGCDYTNGFAVHTYSSDECNPADYTGYSDSMSSFNQAMEAVQCVPIYNSGTSNSNSYSNSSSYEGTPLALLSYSSACYYQDYWSPDGECPDPYGRIKFYQENYNKGVQVSKNTDPFEMYTKQMEESEELRHMGTMMMIAAGVVLIFGFLIPFFCKRATRRPKKVLPPPSPTSPPLFDAPEIAVVQIQTAPASPVVAFQQQKSVVASFDEQPQQQKAGIQDAASMDVFLDDAEIVQSRSDEEPPQEVKSQKRGFARKLRGVFGKK